MVQHDLSVIYIHVMFEMKMNKKEHFVKDVQKKNT